MTDDLPVFAPGFGTKDVKPSKPLTPLEAMGARVAAHKAAAMAARVAAHNDAGSSGPRASEPEPPKSFLDGVKVAPSYAAEVKKIFGHENLRAWRVARGMSQFQAAVHTGISLSTWIRWETKGVPELKRARLKEILK